MNQMQRTAFFSTAKGIIIILLVLIASGHALAADVRLNAVEWQLSDTKVVSWGTLVTSAEGRMRSGIRIEGKAAAKTPAGGSAEGIFSITMTAFSPSEDMPGQKKGFWYLSGNWTITASDADPAAQTSPYMLSGVLKASVPFDITVVDGVMEADVRLQHRGVRPRGGRVVMGSFSGTTKLEGRLTIPFIPSSGGTMKQH